MPREATAERSKRFVFSAIATTQDGVTAAEERELPDRAVCLRTAGYALGQGDLCGFLMPAGDLDAFITRQTGKGGIVNLANNELQRNQTELALAKSKLEEYARSLEARVQVSEEKFRGCLTASPDAMLVVDELGNIDLASQRVETIFGYLPDETVGQPFDLLMPERFRGTYAQHCRRLRARPACA